MYLQHVGLERFGERTVHTALDALRCQRHVVVGQSGNVGGVGEEGFYFGKDCCVHIAEVARAVRLHVVVALQTAGCQHVGQGVFVAALGRHAGFHLTLYEDVFVCLVPTGCYADVHQRNYLALVFKRLARVDGALFACAVEPHLRGSAAIGIHDAGVSVASQLVVLVHHHSHEAVGVEPLERLHDHGSSWAVLARQRGVFLAKHALHGNFPHGATGYVGVRHGGAVRSAVHCGDVHNHIGACEGFASINGYAYAASELRGGERRVERHRHGVGTLLRVHIIKRVGERGHVVAAPIEEVDLCIAAFGEQGVHLAHGGRRKASLRCKAEGKKYAQRKKPQENA